MSCEPTFQHRGRHVGVPSFLPIAVLLLLAMLATACSSDDVSGSPVDRTSSDNGEVIKLGDDEIALVSALGTLPTCDALLDYLRTEGAARRRAVWL